MSETIIKSAVHGSPDISVIRAVDCVVIAKGECSHPSQWIVCIHDEDFPAVFAALKRIENERLEQVLI